jgi:hypothetical protein
MQSVDTGPKRSTSRDNTAITKRKEVLLASKLNKYTQVASPKSSPSASSLGKVTRTSENVVDMNDRTHDADDGLPSPMTSNDHMLGVDRNSNTASVEEDMLMEDDDAHQRKENGTSDLGPSGRSRRARPQISYVERFSDDTPDQDWGLAAVDEDEDGDGYEDEDDVYMSPISDEEGTEEEESEADMESACSDKEASVISDAQSLDITVDEQGISVEDDQPRASARKQKKTGESTRAGKGIDLSLPPLSNIQDCMVDMTAKATEFGLCEALKILGDRPIRVATMCSGTESPLLALDEISKGQSFYAASDHQLTYPVALKAMGHPPMHIQHEFSAEIEIFKQGYIERNFHPPRLFRDVRDFLRESATTAVTAYGAEVDIPTKIDILIAGFVCKDLSRLNNKGKTLDDGGESDDTWEAIRTYAERFRPSIVLIENVKNEKKTWDNVVKRFAKIGYEAQWVYCDTKNYYLPQTRERMYMIAIERSHFGEGVSRATSRWKELMHDLERQCSSPYEAFLPESLKESSGYSLLKNEPDWALCKLRNDHIRSEKRLGVLSPISRRSDDGTVM